VLRAIASEFGANREQRNRIFDLRFRIVRLKTSGCLFEESKVYCLDYCVNPPRGQSSIALHCSSVSHIPHVKHAGSRIRSDLEMLRKPSERFMCAVYTSEHRNRVLALEQIVRMISESLGEESSVKKNSALLWLTRRNASWKRYRRTDGWRCRYMQSQFGLL
jgi:hypothetical protein